MDYDALAKKYDGADAAPVIDYDALAKQYGGADMPASTGIPTARRAPGAMAQLGRSAASLADVTVGGVIPAVVQQVAYPFLRVGRSPEEATARTQSLVSGFEKPFGKTFGVTETPEYQQEAGRQVLDFIGQNFQKGAKWISERTGIPASDVENMIGTATVAAPKVAPVVAREAVKAGKQVAENVSLAAKMPFEKQIQARRERMSLEDYAKGPQIDAAAEAQRLGIALNPVDIEPSAGSRLTSIAAGEKGVQAVTKANKNQVRNIVLKDLDLPPTMQLDGDTAFNQARSQAAAPYEQIKKLPIQQADDAMIQRLEAVRADLDVIGAKEYAPAISKIVDDAIAKTQTGLTGEALLKNISVLRERARKTYNNKAATTEALDIADTNLKIATELESLIDNSIFNPKLLGEYRDARQKMAKTYAYEGATDFNTGIVDVSKLARITQKNNALTGDIASLGKVAGNFPEAFTTKAASPWSKVLSVGRTGAAGTLGGLTGYALGQDYISAAAGTVLGAFGGKVGESIAASRIASPSYQAGLNLRDMRLPVNQLAASMQPIPQNRAVVPYEAPVEVLGPGEGPYQPNFVFGRPEAQVTPSAPNMMNALPAPGSPLNALRAEDVRRAQMSRTLGQQAEQQAAAAEAAARQPARGGSVLEVDPVTGKITIGAEGGRGATPATQIIESTGKSLQGAADILASGKSPALMTAEQKIAWEKTKVDLAEVMPGMKALSDKAIAAKMQDRAWVQQSLDKAQQQARAFDDIAARAANERLRQQAIMKREQMLDLAEQLQDALGSRPVSRGGQGPKTRAFQRNMLAPEQEVQNALAERAVKIDLKGMAK
jgi:CheY-like chemotaxis protein